MSNIPSIFPYVAPLVFSITLSVLFLYLYLTYRLRYLGIWTAAWTLWSLRMGYAILLQDTLSESGGNFLLILILSYTTLILLGAAELGGQRVMKVWLPLAVFAFVIRIAASSIGYEQSGFVVYLLILGSGWIWAGLIFESSNRHIGHVRWLPAISLIAMGFHQWAVPIYQQYPAYTPWLLNITLPFQIWIAVGVLIVFNNHARIQLTEAHAALEKSLNKVLSGFIPICANCNSICDDQKQWHRLEHYISERTDAEFSHGICPNCKAELYPELKQA